MQALMTAHLLSKSYGLKTLFDRISISIHQKDRIGLIGPNGSGKSSLIKILAGEEKSDSGSVSMKKGIKIGYSAQNPTFSDTSILEILLEKSLDRTKEIESASIDTLTKARTLLSKVGFVDFTLNATTLSGGWQKKLDIARIFMQDPDLLLLDEPTNHLDLEAILWLETFLQKLTIPYLVISHDRVFLEKVTNKTIEINRCYENHMMEVEGNYLIFQERKKEFLEAQKKREIGLSSFLKEEKKWLKTTPKARTSKPQFRIQNAYKMIEEHAQIQSRNKEENIYIDFTPSKKLSKKLLVAKNIAKNMGGKTLFHKLDLTLSQNTRLGICGKNGSGKTTLLKVLSQKIPQDIGTIKYADELTIAYFDQKKEEIHPEITIKEALSPNGEFVLYRGEKIHVKGWAKRFLFDPDSLSMKVKFLSGGERARILIAKLMLQKADILFLDEPTNDLDIPTLEVMEESFSNFSGAIVLITHDRCLMQRVCDQIIGLGIEEKPHFFSDYQKWEEAEFKNSKMKKEARAANEKKIEKRKKPLSPKKLSSKEKKELNGMEGRLLEKEEQIDALAKKIEALSDNDPKETLPLYEELAKEQKNLEALYHRWQELLDLSEK